MAAIAYDKTRKAYGTGTRKRPKQAPRKKSISLYDGKFATALRRALEELYIVAEVYLQQEEQEYLFADWSLDHMPYGQTMESHAKELREFLQAAREDRSSIFREAMTKWEKNWQFIVSVKELHHLGRSVWLVVKPRVNVEDLNSRIQQQLAEGEEDS